MNLLITGATGFLGSRLIEYFADVKDITNIVGTGRKFSFNNKSEAPNVTYKLGDLADPGFVQSLFDFKPEIVVNCASRSSPWGKFEDFYRSNCLTQQNLIQQSQKTGVQRFIYISTPSIYFNFKDRMGIKELAPLPKIPCNHYAKTKLEAENMLATSELCYITLRPRALVGRGDTVIMPRLIRSHKAGRLKIFGNGKNVVDLTPVSNMVDAVHLAILADDKYCGEDYNISNGAPVLLWDEINSVLKKIGLSPITQKVNSSLLTWMAKFMESKSRIFHPEKEPILTAYSVGVLSKSFIFDITKAKNDLKYIPKQSTSEAIDEFVDWYLKNQNEN